jgi:hypothetical protein
MRETGRGEREEQRKGSKKREEEVGRGRGGGRTS